MAAEGSVGGSIEVSPWLKSMPVAPEYHPTMAEFQDPIAYIFKIEKEASKYGICKIVPPVPAGSKKSIIANLHKSLLARSNDPNSGPTFTTRQQQVGFCPRKQRPVQKPVWQSGERYTVSEFEAKAKNFEKNYLKKYAKKGLNALEIETLYWNATVDKPFSVEYANDMPGSAFAVKKSGGKKKQSVMTVGETEWNMRVVSRANFSLLKFMKEEIPGVTSPMVYLAMLFSWFAWHVEDHDLHSLNFLHMGAAKTWYGVPRDAAFAFEEVIREHGYSGEINPLVTFATLGEKTTVMSPEVLLSAGVPCCRLVQNAGEFVITFPRAYHSGFSHGFNCGEASNIATPEWLWFAKEAAMRRASINCPPMVSHYQLLYDLALSLCSRVPKSIEVAPRSSRLKDKRKGEGEMLIKEFFVQDMMQNNDWLNFLGKGAPAVHLPHNSLSSSIFSKSKGGFQSASKSRLFPTLCSSDLQFRTKSYNTRDDFISERKQGMKQTGDNTVNGTEPLLSNGVPSLAFHSGQVDSEFKKTSRCEQGLFSCVTCGILCFACVAIVQPTETAACWLMSSDCSTLKDMDVYASDSTNFNGAKSPDVSPTPEFMLEKKRGGLLNVPICSAAPVPDLDEQSADMVSNNRSCNSSLGLLALMYGNSSDTEDEAEIDTPIEGSVASESICPDYGFAHGYVDSESNDCSEVSIGPSREIGNGGNSPSFCTDEFRTNNCTVIESNSLTHSFRQQIRSGHDNSKSIHLTHYTGAQVCAGSIMSKNAAMSISSKSDEDSSRLHVFCLQHAVQVAKKLQLIGGANVFLVCHPDYPKLESDARKVAEELEADCLWNDISFREATEDDEEMIRLALDSENAIHGNGDWAVKMGINLFYSSSLSRSPLYCKQMPYNFVVYSAFGRNSPSDRPAANCELENKASSRPKKIVVAGKWCGKVWMSSQAHPLLVNVFQEGQKQELQMVGCLKPGRRDPKPSELKQGVEIASSTRRMKNGAETSSCLNAELHETEGREESAFSTFRKRKWGATRLKKLTSEGENLDESSEECQFVKPRKKNVVENSSDMNKMEGTDKSAFSTFSKRKRKATPLKKETPGSENLNESSEELQVANSRKQMNSRCGTKQQLRKQSPKDENLDDSSEEFPLCNSWEMSRSKPVARPVKMKAPDLPKNQPRRSKKKVDSLPDDESEGGPSTRLRKREMPPLKNLGLKLAKVKSVPKKQQPKDTASKKAPGTKVSASHKTNGRAEEVEYLCDMEGCTMSFGSKQELSLHKRNICPLKGCGKKFFSHKYLVQHRRVHMDDRPLKCPWKGCKMTFKWAWARTEHIRVHTGARPYVCTEAGCGQTFRFVSDFSRHKRKTGHTPKKARG